MRWTTLLAVASACAPSGGIESSAPDAAAAPVSVDARPSLDSGSNVCRVVMPDPSSTNAGIVGGTGGGKGPALACDDVFNERIVGVAMQMSNQATAFGGRSAQGIRIACATVTVDPAGTATIGGVTTHEVSGTGTAMWSPSTWTAMTSCKPGWVVSGVLAHKGTTNNLFVDVSITCSQLGANGALGASETMKVAGSLTNTANPSQVKCPAGTAVSQLGTWTGAGLDALTLFCAAPTCS